MYSRDRPRGGANQFREIGGQEHYKNRNKYYNLESAGRASVGYG